jgi:hypothetical protein
METLTFHIEETHKKDMDRILASAGKSPDIYLNAAVAKYNKEQLKLLIAKQLKLESEAVRDNSMEVLGEFENVEF